MPNIIIDLWQRLAGGGGKMSYAKAKKLASHDDPEVRRQLAARDDIQPEILYFLAEDPVANVRRQIAVNAATPMKADALLVRDDDEEIRSTLARKFGDVAPRLSEEQREDVQRMAVEAMEVLARDQAARVRQILSEALKDVADAPPSVIRRLARDAELLVSAPVLQFSPVLTDEDLLEIIDENPVSGALSAISRRSSVPESLADAIVGADDIDAITNLLANPSAQIREETLDRVIDRARQADALQEPLVRRPTLPLKAAAKLGSFVADNMLQVLDGRDDLDAESMRAVKEEVQRRLQEATAGAAAKKTESASDTIKPGRRPEKHSFDVDPTTQIGPAIQMKRIGTLDALAIRDALERGEKGFIVAALSVLADMPVEIVLKIVATGSAKGMTAIAWKAGLTMHLAADLQLRLAGIKQSSILPARDGTEFPLSEEDMLWQLDFFRGMAEDQSGSG